MGNLDPRVLPTTDMPKGLLGAGTLRRQRFGPCMWICMIQPIIMLLFCNDELVIYSRDGIRILRDLISEESFGVNYIDKTRQ